MRVSFGGHYISKLATSDYIQENGTNSIPGHWALKASLDLATLEDDREGGHLIPIKAVLNHIYF